MNGWHLYNSLEGNIPKRKDDLVLWDKIGIAEYRLSKEQLREERREKIKNIGL